MELIYIIICHLLVLTLIFLSFLTKRGRKLIHGTLDIRINISRVRIISSIFIALLPIISMLGTIRLNNGGSSVLIETVIVLMAGAIIAYLIKPTLFNVNWLLFNIALSLLLSTSMRSSFISGFDISQEFHVFTLTLQQQFWDMKSIPGNTYNACMSITILPSILQKVLNISPELIFKFGAQILFATSALIVYQISRVYTNSAPKRCDGESLLAINTSACEP